VALNANIKAEKEITRSKTAGRHNYLLKDRLAREEAKSPRSVKRGEGKILIIDGERVAAYRDEAGKLTKLSPVCAHLGCLVNWNEAEGSWDCP
jgi:Rieske Fe-S protein